eukprot:Platyproteum_vivax@DN13967_c0_g1_i2.p1
MCFMPTGPNNVPALSNYGPMAAGPPMFGGALGPLPVYSNLQPLGADSRPPLQPLEERGPTVLGDGLQPALPMSPAFFGPPLMGMPPGGPPMIHPLLAGNPLGVHNPIAMAPPVMMAPPVTPTPPATMSPQPKMQVAAQATAQAKATATKARPKEAGSEVSGEKRKKKTTEEEWGIGDHIEVL